MSDDGFYGPEEPVGARRPPRPRVVRSRVQRVRDELKTARLVMGASPSALREWMEHVQSSLELIVEALDE